MKSQDEINERIRQTPLLERLERSKSLIAGMCGGLRPPKMSVPPEPQDEDMFIICTLADAISEIERLQAVKPLQNWRVVE